MKVLITGAQGQLGYHLRQELQGHDLYCYSRAELDVTDPAQTQQVITAVVPDVLIHVAAYTDVDSCESNIELAYRVNAFGTQNVALACQQVGAMMVYISTDYVFDGQKQTPYSPGDRPNPLNVYGRTKLAGEQFVSSLLDRYYIIRTSWLFGNQGSNFVRTILKLAQEQSCLSIVNDQVGSPTYAKDLAVVIAKLIGIPCYGLYHVANLGAVSWYQFAQKIVSLKNLAVTVVPITSQELGRPAQRPHYSVLSCIDIERMLGLKLRAYEDALLELLVTGGKTCTSDSIY